MRLQAVLICRDRSLAICEQTRALAEGTLCKPHYWLDDLRDKRTGLIQASRCLSAAGCKL